MTTPVGVDFRVDKAERHIKELKVEIVDLGKAGKVLHQDFNTSKRAVNAWVKTLQTATVGSKEWFRAIKNIDRILGGLRGRVDGVRKAVERETFAERENREAVERATRSRERSTRSVRRSEDRLRRHRRELERNTRSTRNAVQTLRTFTAAVAAGFVALRSAGALAETADQVTNLENRIRALGGASVNVEAVRDSLVQLAKDSRAPLENVSTLFTRFTVATSGTNASVRLTQKEVLQLTQNLLRLGVVSGATTQELVAGTQQFAQALASGFLQGDELRSIRENLPAVAQAVAKEFGVSVGELKRLGAEGKITGETLARSVLKATSDIDEKWKNVNFTIGQILTVFKTTFTENLGVLDDQAKGTEQIVSAVAGAAERLADATNTVANNINLIINAVQALLIYTGAGALQISWTWIY